MTIKIKHKTDYYGIEYNGIYGELDELQGSILKKLLEAVKQIAENADGITS